MLKIIFFLSLFLLSSCSVDNSNSSSTSILSRSQDTSTTYDILDEKNNPIYDTSLDDIYNQLYFIYIPSKEFSFAVFMSEPGVNNKSIKEILNIYKDYIINKHNIDEEIICFKAYLELDDKVDILSDDYEMPTATYRGNFNIYFEPVFK